MNFPFSEEPAPYLDQLEAVVQSAVDSAIPRNWNEDFITRTWITALLEFFQTRSPLPAMPRPFGVSIDAFKASGRLEIDHGDVAFLVRLNFPGGGITEGVGLLEAKRSDGDTERFPAFRRDQLEVHLAHSTCHKTLLYDTRIRRPEFRVCSE